MIKKISKRTITLLIMLLSVSVLICAQKRNYAAPGISRALWDKYRKKIFVEGDVDAYNKLNKASYPEKNLPYLFVMADKYHYPDAYCDVYDVLVHPYENYKVSIDSVTQKLALDYLRKGVELNSLKAKKRMSTLYLYGKYVPQDTILSKQLYKESCGISDSVMIENSWQKVMSEYKNEQENKK